MKENKWTKGPWAASYVSVIVGSLVRSKDDKNVCAVLPQVDVGLSRVLMGETEANSNLIAAAPELYEALEIIYTKTIGLDLGSDAKNYEKARAVLARARGEK